MAAQQASVAATDDGLRGVREFGTEWQHLRDEQHSPRPSCGLDHALGGVGLKGDGFLDEDVLAGLESLDGHRFVLIRRRAKVDEINLGIGEQVLVARMAAQVRQVHVGAGGTEVAANARPVAGEAGGVARVQGGNATTAQTLGGEVVHHAHESKTDYTNSHHRRIS